MYNTERYVFYPNLEVVTVIHFRKSHCHQKRSEGGRVGEEGAGRKVRRPATPATLRIIWCRAGMLETAGKLENPPQPGRDERHREPSRGWAAHGRNGKPCASKRYGIRKEPASSSRCLFVSLSSPFLSVPLPGRVKTLNPLVLTFLLLRIPILWGTIHRVICQTTIKGG